MMARILVFLVFVVSVTGYRHNLKFPKDEETNGIKIVSCSAHESSRSEIMKKSRCGEPKEVFVDLKPQSTYETVVPSAVWVHRCVGLCNEGPHGSKCMPTKTRTAHIPVRITNLVENSERCATYAVEVHESCGCGCDRLTKECSGPKVYNPRKCNCQCPDMKERRNCLKQRSQGLKWNPSKCICEKRRR